METPICPTCGCSLVRLGLSREQALTFHYNGKRYWFCCAGCLELFQTTPEQLLLETSGLTVCPACLAEKPVNHTVECQFDGVVLNFCRCPYCLELFNTDKAYFIKRLAWKTDYAGVFGGTDHCCGPQASSQ